VIKIFDHERKEILFVKPLLIDYVEIKADLLFGDCKFFLKTLVYLADSSRGDTDILDFLILASSELLPE